MLTAKQYRFQAVECLELAQQAEEIYVRTALSEMAAEFQKMAELLERRERADNHRQVDGDISHRRRCVG
jgi:hypothetical protein